MNKYENAIDVVARYCSHVRSGVTPRMILTNELDILMELVEKATPKKPIPLKWENNRCPNCKCYLPTKRNALKKREPRIYCDRCGQALDWGKQDG